MMSCGCFLYMVGCVYNEQSPEEKRAFLEFHYALLDKELNDRAVARAAAPLPIADAAGTATAGVVALPSGGRLVVVVPIPSRSRRKA